MAIMRSIRVATSALLLGAQSCASTATNVRAAMAAPEAEGANASEPALAARSDERALDMTKRFEAYPLRDAAWVDGQPLLVNTEFDFALATLGEGFGVAIAAAKRRERGADIARRLRGVDTAGARRLAHTRELLRDGNSNRAVIYGFLFGDRSARLLTTVELGALRAHLDDWSVRLVHVSQARAFEGSDSWTAEHGARVSQAMEQSIDHLRSLRTLMVEPLAQSSQAVVCRAAAGLKLEGLRVAEVADCIVLASSQQPRTYVVCPRDLISPAALADTHSDR